MFARLPLSGSVMAAERRAIQTACCLAPAMSGYRTPNQIPRLFWEGFEVRLIPVDGG